MAMNVTRLIITIFVCLLFHVAVNGQDRIYFNDSAPVDALIEEIGDDYVLYKTWDNQEGPDYRISLSRVERIVYRNGKEQVFGENGFPGTLAAPGIPVVPGQLVYRHGRYYRGLSVVTPEQIRDYIGYKNYGSVYLKARRQYLAGSYLTYFGAGLLLFGVIAVVADASAPSMSGDFGNDSFMTGTGTVCGILGAAGLASGIPLMVKGNRQLDAIADDYNSRHGYGMKGNGRRMSLTLGPCHSGGTGLAFNF